MTGPGTTHHSIYPATLGTKRKRLIRASFLLAAGILALPFQPTTGFAQNSESKEAASPAVTVGNLSGTWVISLGGTTGCGIVTMRTLAGLGSSGSTSGASTVTHGQCGDSTVTESFAITSLNSAGTGTAHLSCGEGCGWDFDIQVAPGNNVFNLVDVTNSENYLSGVAIRKP